MFHFDCAPTAFRGALERFASQFEAPLCAESATAREVRAVDSEFTQAQQSDSARLLQVQCAGAPAGHPAALFSWVRFLYFHQPRELSDAAMHLACRATPRALWRMWRRLTFRCARC